MGGAVLGLFVPKAVDTCVEEVGVGLCWRER